MLLPVCKALNMIRTNENDNRRNLFNMLDAYADDLFTFSIS